MSSTTPEAPEDLRFEAEVTRILDIVVNALYSEKEIFLRELISNASDACDRLRYQALTEPHLTEGDADFRVELEIDKAARTLTVRDNGIGMNRDDLIANLGTIARSGTGEFLKRLSGDSKADISLIGQFGVGFYSAFMVAGRIEVLTRKAGEDQAWQWASQGDGRFTVGPAGKPARGTEITLHLKEGEDEFLEAQRLRHIVKTYSDHIAIPVVLKAAAEPPREGEDAPTDETLNTASALWTRPKSEITEEQYKEFYHHVAHGFDDPWHTLHLKAEGAIEYTALLFVPGTKPFDLFQPERKPHVKLYVNRVFITDDCEGLLPPYLRFMRGVVDSPDLPLNISREMLQNNPVLAKIRTGLVGRILSDLKKRAEDKEAYATFWAAFGAVLKEGLYEDFAKRDEILDLCRFRTTNGSGLASLAEVAGRLKEGQKAIYYLTGDDPEALMQSPQIEGFKAKGIEVLLLTDPIDEFWVSSVGTYKEHPIKSVAQAGKDLSEIKGEAADEAEEKAEEAPEDKIAGLIGVMKTALGEAVKEVRASERLRESPVCLSSDMDGMSLHLQRLLKAHNADAPETPRVLEINPRHPIIKALAERAEATANDAEVGEVAHLLLDQARIVEGEAVPDPAAFARRLSKALEQGLLG
ncbi:molecular chaperone HtpG [Roseospirillum parvum]|uniref:Chaperone protein HtpG n=1 Tax=Roseospirillum parvum TaxID=83401 RepID=A0A1G7XVY8_9PROT|nr:molecular chaperone HtpG [Roseospirillum parvum]SDG87900.1 molecular chaperone HtpG [Roseospirillum parvum]